MKILLVCRNYETSDSANAVCIKRLAEQFVNDGDDVVVVSEYNRPVTTQISTNSSRLKIYRINDCYTSLLQQKFANYDSIINRILHSILINLNRILVFSLYPHVKPFHTRKIVRLIREIFERTGQADVVIGFYRPYECVDVVTKVKKIFGEKICSISYHLDLISEPDFKNKLIRTYKSCCGRYAFKREVNILDGVLVPEIVRNQKFLQGKNSNKIFHVGFPLYLPQNKQEESGVILTKDCINIVYIGSLDDINRSPEYLINLLKNLNCYRSNNSKKTVVLHIWGNIVGIRTLKCIQTITAKQNVRYYGTIDNPKVSDVLNKSDFLLNIGNQLLYNMVPSKIFQLFSTRKPIINVIRHRDDASIPFFEKYGFYFPINEYKDEKDIVIKLSDFVDMNLNKTANVSDQVFEKNKPEYTVNLVHLIKKALIVKQSATDR